MLSLAVNSHRLSRQAVSLLRKMSQDSKLNHLFEESAALNVYDMKTMNLAAGCPGPDLLSTLPDIISKATAHQMEAEKDNNCYLFQYGPTAGWWGARRALSEFLTRHYGSEVNRENIVLTAGATHGLHLIVSIMLAPNAVIFVEEYTYMIALRLLEEFPNHKIIPVPMDSNGVKVDELRKLVTQAKNETVYEVSAKKPFWSMFYTIPMFQNPTGVVLSPDRCKEVAKISEELDMLVFCDDVYNLLYYGEDPYPPPRLFSYGSADGNIISNGSFSKILAPGLRIGWMELPERLVARFRQSGIIQSGGSVNNMMFGLLQSIIELGLADKQLLWYRQVYKERMATLTKTLQKHLPKTCSFEPSEGGYFIWVRVPIEAAAFLTWCMKKGGPGAVPAARFTVESASPFDTASIQNLYSPALRLSIGFHNCEMLEKAGKDICQKLQEYMAENLR